MANLKETSQWEDGIYQLEKTDKVMGGADGISNLQAKQLANRTTYLKEKAEELQERVDEFAETSPETVLTVAAASAEALRKTRQMEMKLDTEKTVFTQQGEVFITNRGVVEGCTVTKSTDAARNLSLSSGLIFYGSVLIPVSEQANVAVVPSNTGDSAMVCWCYLQKDSTGKYVMRCTQPGQEPPEDSMSIYKVTIPAGNTAETDVQLSAVTLTDVRRVESNWPRYTVNAAYAQVVFDYSWEDTDYDVTLDVVDYVGSGFQQGNIYVAERAKNGFKIYTNGAVDSMRVRYKAARRNA